MKNSTKANGAAAKNSASTPYKVFNVYNPLTDVTFPHRLPLNKETESLPKDIDWKLYDKLREKYGTVPAEQTKAAHAAYMNKLTKKEFAEKYSDIEGVLTLEEIKKATEAVKKLNPLQVYTCKKAYKRGIITYTFSSNGMSLFLTATVNYGGKEYALNGRHYYGRSNRTKVSYDYDFLDNFFIKLLEHAEAVCGGVSVALTVIVVGDSSVGLELHENDEGYTVVATIYDGSATETRVKNIVGELADFFGCALNGIEVRKEGNND